LYIAVLIMLPYLLCEGEDVPRNTDWITYYKRLAMQHNTRIYQGTPYSQNSVLFEWTQTTAITLMTAGKVRPSLRRIAGKSQTLSTVTSSSTKRPINIANTRRQLALDRPVCSSSNVSSKVSQFVFVHLVHNSALCWTPSF